MKRVFGVWQTILIIVIVSCCVIQTNTQPIDYFPNNQYGYDGLQPQMMAPPQQQDPTMFDMMPRFAQAEPQDRSNIDVDGEEDQDVDQILEEADKEEKEVEQEIAQDEQEEAEIEEETADKKKEEVEEDDSEEAEEHHETEHHKESSEEHSEAKEVPVIVEDDSGKTAEEEKADEAQHQKDKEKEASNHVHIVDDLTTTCEDGDCEVLHPIVVEPCCGNHPAPAVSSEEEKLKALREHRKIISDELHKAAHWVKHAAKVIKMLRTKVDNVSSHMESKKVLLSQVAHKEELLASKVENEHRHKEAEEHLQEQKALLRQLLESANTLEQNFKNLETRKSTLMNQISSAKSKLTSMQDEVRFGGILD